MRRVMLKLSGEALGDSADKIYSFEFVNELCKQIKKVVTKKTQLVIMTGGGNIIRGSMLSHINKYKADEIGMLATYMNSLYIQSVMDLNKIKAKVYGAFEASDIAELFSKDKIIKDLNEGYVIILAGGTGHPYFTTDTGVVLRSLELDCDELLLAKSIDGVYDKDPAKYKDAKKYKKISIDEVVDKRLGVIDLSASVLCQCNKLNLKIFSLKEKNSIQKAISGSDIGTLVFS